MEASPRLRVVENHEQIAKDVAESRCLVIDQSTGNVAADARDTITGLLDTIRKQARTIGSLERRITEEEDPMSHPKGKEIVDLIERWMQATGHTKSKVSADRIKTVKSRLRDGYSIEQLTLAVEGIGAYRYVHMAQRSPHGKESERYDELSHALGSGEKVEKAARLGHMARKQGWTPEGGWPERGGDA